MLIYYTAVYLGNSQRSNFFCMFMLLEHPTLMDKKTTLLLYVS
jgi:hypothetical protein